MIFLLVQGNGEFFLVVSRFLSTSKKVSDRAPSSQLNSHNLQTRRNGLSLQLLIG